MPGTKISKLVVTPLLLGAIFFLPLSARTQESCSSLQTQTGVGLLFGGYVRGDGLGHVVAFAGDVDGDGAEDLLLQRDRDFAIVDVEPSVSLISGMTGLKLDRLPAPSNLHLPGKVFGSLGDLTGDGRAEFFVTYTSELYNSPFDGVVQVYTFQNSHAELLYELKSGLNQSALYGAAVAHIHDLDGDGISEILVGAPEAPEGGFCDPVCYNRGRIYLHSGADGALLKTLFNFNEANEYFGASIIPAGDLDGDGFDEFIATDPNFDHSTGFIGVFSSRALYLDEDSLVGGVIGGYSGQQLGLRISLVGSLRPDHTIPILASYIASGEDVFHPSFVSLAVDGGGGFEPQFDVPTPPSDGLFGPIVPWGDINNDGVTDFAISSPGSENTRVAFFSGVEGAELGELASLEAGDAFGSSLATPESAVIPAPTLGLIGAWRNTSGNDWTGITTDNNIPDPFGVSEAGAAYLVSVDLEALQSGTASICQITPEQPDEPGEEGPEDLSIEQHADNAQALIPTARKKRRSPERNLARHNLHSELVSIKSLIGTEGTPGVGKKFGKRLLHTFKTAKSRSTSKEAGRKAWKRLKRLLGKLL